ncbi:rRNA maturation RNase YbeY [Pedobacter sp. ASV1-7]|uniref:rRNA maturation RNase YbeY n=1 Tax=Pedobacter sp. ASV1-7 TaxID=3145237 RepID=UPI0032E89E34
MSKASINFFNEETNYLLKNKRAIKDWVASAIAEEGYILQELNFILCSDEYLLRINQEYLDHDTYTDVITFDNSEVLKTIVGDIFISIERIKENADTFKHTVTQELCRVIIHGTLHLLGYRDKSKAEKLKMTEKEDYYLELLLKY